MLQRADVLLPAWRAGTFAGTVSALRHHAVLVLLVASYAVLVGGVLSMSGLGHLWHLQWRYPFLDVMFVAWGLGLAVVSFANRRLTTTFTPERMASALIVWALIPLLGDSFSSWKQAMWYLVPFNRDAWLHAADVWLHGGRAPSLWLLPMLSAPVLRALDVVYAFWFLLIMGTLVGFAWARPSIRRQQFLISVVLVWVVIGSILAAAAGSAGPCYYARLVRGPDPYAALLHHLDVTNVPPLVARRLQADLWQWMEGHTWRAFAGISAMPSVHVAMATVLALAWASVHRIGAGLGAIFVTVTLVGSVALGWHYAIDGYVGAAAAVLVWRVAGRMAHWAMETA